MPQRVKLISNPHNSVVRTLGFSSLPLFGTTLLLLLSHLNWGPSFASWASHTWVKPHSLKEMTQGMGDTGTWQRSDDRTAASDLPSSGAFILSDQCSTGEKNKTKIKTKQNFLHFLKGNVSHSALLQTPAHYDDINEITKLNQSQCSA